MSDYLTNFRESEINVPVDATISYPFFFYEAGHFVSEDMEEFEEETSKIPLLVDFILKKGYKKVIFAITEGGELFLKKLKRFSKKLMLNLST